METPLHWAIYRSASVATVKLLIQHGADPSLENWKGDTPMDFTYLVPDPLDVEYAKAMDPTGTDRRVGDAAEDVSSAATVHSE